MLALVGSILAAVLIALLLFFLGYTRLIGSSQEQRTAIEAAALAAAKDISRIVINDSNFGFISLSDAAPVGKDTIAGDNYFMPVNGIDTLMGTIRLDLIIANTMNNQTMKALAKRDLANLKTAKDRLIDAIETAIQNGGTAKDLDGNIVTPYQSAEAAYTQNQVRMTGSSSYVPNSLRLTLGSVVGGVQTNVPVPIPQSLANVGSTQQQNGYYLSSVNIPYDNEAFVFAAIGDSLKLVDPKRFAENLSNVPYQMPSVIKAEADQDLRDAVHNTTRRVHAVACAEPASVHDPKPAPGTLTLSFPDQLPPEIVTIGDILNLPNMSGGVPLDLKKADNGDYPMPGTALTPLPWSGPGSPNGTTVVSAALYDWLKRAGSKLDAQNLSQLLTAPIQSHSGGGIHIFTLRPDGKFQYNMKQPLEPDPYWVASHNQLYGVGFDALNSSDGNTYDIHVRDFSYKQGTINGGIHGGEPLANNFVQVPITLGPFETSTLIASDALEIKLAADLKNGSGNGGECGGSGDGATSWIWIGGPPPGPPTSVQIGGQWYKIWPNAAGSAMVRNDFGLGAGGATQQFPPGPAGGLMRPTYLQNGAVVDIRFRHAVPYIDPVDGVTQRKGYKGKKETTTP